MTIPANQQHDDNAAPALVVGLSVHGLAVARALARHGVVVHCLANVETPPKPTVYTRYATVHFTTGLNSSPLAEVLLAIADTIAARSKIVLFPTSDRIAKGIAAAWPQLRARYLLSWSHCLELVLQLQGKDSLADYAERAGVRYPKSRNLLAAADCAAAAEGLEYPLAVKPAQPLSSFKAIRVHNLRELQDCADSYVRDLPFVIQEWIEGPEPSLYACTTYLDHGKPLFLFTSRKIAAYPPGLGQGTVFETVDSAEACELAERFLRPFDLSGPVAVEFKRDAAGRYWLIEPNVGRTEYCVDLAVHSGYNLPLVEYLHVTGRAAQIRVADRATECAWFDTDKDPTCFVANLGLLRSARGVRRRAVFPFLGHADRRPLLVSCEQQLAGYLRSAGRRLARLFGRSTAKPTDCPP